MFGVQMFALSERFSPAAGCWRKPSAVRRTCEVRLVSRPRHVTPRLVYWFDCWSRRPWSQRQQ